MLRRAAVLLALAAAPAAAQPAQGDPSQGTGPLPTPNAAPVSPPICTDRPTKANVACTVPAGDVQVETDLLNWARDRSGGDRQDTLLYTYPTVKLGLGTHTDAEAEWSPHASLRTRAADGTVTRAGGVGDLTLRVKQRLTADGAKAQVALIPFVTAPTATHGVGAGGWQGGLILAADVPLPADFTFTVGPEADVLVDDDGHGHHAALAMLANLSHPVVAKLTAFAELWTQQEFAPGGTLRRHSADLALAWQPFRTWEFDLGANLGLDRQTPGEQVSLGLSTRF